MVRAYLTGVGHRTNFLHYKWLRLALRNKRNTRMDQEMGYLSSDAAVFYQGRGTARHSQGSRTRLVLCDTFTVSLLLFFFPVPYFYLCVLCYPPKTLLSIRVLQLYLYPCLYRFRLWYTHSHVTRTKSRVLCFSAFALS